MYKYYFKHFGKLKFLQRRDIHKVSVFGPTLTPIYPLKMAEIKNSQLTIQIIQNQSPISFQISMKTIITFCSIWTFFRYDWVIDPGSKIIKSQLKLASLSRKSLIIVSDHFLIMDLFLSATQRMERIDCISRYRILC